jgi:Uma2 family endonuclease
MIVPAQTLPPMSPETYLDYERDSDCRHELVAGYLYAMTGASDRHEEIVANLLAAIHGHLGQGGCRVYGANLKIRVGDDFFYPDLFVRCAKERGDPFFKTDPLLVIEVLSPNTQRYDRGDKRLAYQSLPSLLEYVMVAQDSARIEVLSRAEPGWGSRVYDSLDELLVLSSIGLTLPLTDIYT